MQINVQVDRNVTNLVCSDYYVPMIAEEVFKQGRICIMHLEAI